VAVLRPIFIEDATFLVQRSKNSRPRVGSEDIELSAFQPDFLAKATVRWKLPSSIAVEPKDKEAMYADTGIMQFFDNGFVFLDGIGFFIDRFETGGR